jgi:hypothetical protein
MHIFNIGIRRKPEVGNIIKTHSIEVFVLIEFGGLPIGIAMYKGVLQVFTLVGQHIKA